MVKSHFFRILLATSGVNYRSVPHRVVAMARLDMMIFLISTVIMALKPLLLHLTGESVRSEVALPPAFFQLSVEALKAALCSMALLSRRGLGMSAAVWSGWWHTASFALPAAVYLLMNVLTVAAARMLWNPRAHGSASLVWTDPGVQSMSGQSSEQSGSVRYFSGDSEDSKEYKRWKTWCCNKLLTLHKLPKSARGSYVYTLLSGKALEAIEHLEPSTYQCDGGDEVIWKLLDSRFPQKEKVDELGEIMGEVFSLRVKEGESMKMWTARSQEVFERCNRKTGVSFPDQARGWLTLHRSGLTEEQKAVVIARASGDLNREPISVALRSCYPDLIVRKKAAASVEEVFPVEDGDDDLPVDSEFSDVAGLLEDHMHESENAGEDFPESDVAEVLAATWREKRQELNRLQKSRQFGKAKEVRRSFRVEVEELKAKTSCHKCGKRGHWARECPSAKGQSKGAKASGSTTTTSGAAAVVSHMDSAVDFVASVVQPMSMLEQLRKRANQSDIVAGDELNVVGLVSSPGYGVLDSGCGRTIVGANTLKEFEKIWIQKGMPSPEFVTETHQFKYGNGEVETSSKVVLMPVTLAGKKGVIRASIVRGDAPLLVSRSALKKLGASLDFARDTLRLFGQEVPLQVNLAGQYVVHLVADVSDSLGGAFAEVMSVDRRSEVCAETVVEPVSSENADVHSSQAVADPIVMSPAASQPSDAKVEDVHDPPISVWVQENSGVSKIPLLSQDGPQWHKVVRRIVRSADSFKVLADHSIAPGTVQKNTLHPLNVPDQHVITEYHFVGPACFPAASRKSSESSSWKPTARQSRQLHSQVKVSHEVCSAEGVSEGDRIRLMEVFSPPRFAPVVEAQGFKARSYDLKTGYDLSTASDRKKVEQDLVQHRPELLVLSPPCTHEGGWFNLNCTKMERWEYLQLKARSRSYIRWCCKLYRLQVSLGGRAFFEHPTGAHTWGYPEVQSLCKCHTTVKLHMCRFGLQLPHSERLIRKSTRLLVSDPEMKGLGLLCPGPSDPAHKVHDVVQGHAPGVPSVSQYVGAYTPKFVHAVLEYVPLFRSQPALCVHEDCVIPQQWEQVLAVSETKPTKEELLPVIKKLHQNLGHPPNTDMVRILRHAQASPEAIELARHFECDFCKSMAKPKVPLPAQPNRVHEFNHQIGIDVKNLRGWLPNQKVKALNIVDTASSFQRVIPFFQQETASVLRKLLADHWIAWTGAPKEIVLDPAQTNLGEHLVGPCELEGSHIRPIAAGAHWQLGKTESHGGWFAHVLDKIIEEHQPKSQEEWLQCVMHAHVKNQMIQVHGYSPHQFVFGRGVNIPDDLLNEPVSVVPATASLTEENLAKSQAMRTTARIALARLQDDRSARVALLARPRKHFEFKPGDSVAYWRCQKWIQGKLQQGGRWYGPAVVIGTVGRNLILIHRKQLLRCAPEQVRPSTSEEKQLSSTPQVELLGARRRVTGKDGPMSFYRPPAMRQDDFVEVMKEVVPQLLDQVLSPDADSVVSHKRPADDVERTPSESVEPASSRARVDEVLSVQDCSELLALVDQVPTEVFMAEYLKKKMAKELPHSRNPPELQKLVDEGKLLEWQTLLSKSNAVKVHYGKAAERIKRDFAHRFIGSRFVLTRKPIEEGKEINPLDSSTFLVKGRWCLQGHLDPDLNLKAEAGLLKSPTLSQLGRMLLMQIIASQGWDLQLGDIKGAFLEAGPLDPKFKPLYAHQPPGGIPGMPPEAVIEVLGNVYGQNDAPAAWFKEFDSVVKSLGWCQSRLDPCLYTLREGSELVGIMGVHVDDTALGGSGSLFSKSIEQLKRDFHTGNGVTVKDFRKANQAVRRAKLESQLEIVFKPIALDKLTVVCHSDAAWANVGSHTQAGYIIAFTEKELQDGKMSSWCPATWRSFRLSRAVSSTLAAEAQAMSIATSTVEWLLLLLSETIDGPLEIAKCRDVLKDRPPILVTDCDSCKPIVPAFSFLSFRSANFISLRHLMASPNPAISAMLKELLCKARAEGSLDMVVAEVLAEHGDEFELIPGGPSGVSMTDASKRRMTSPPESEAVVSGPDNAKGITGESPVSFGTKLPAGVNDLSHWGKTILMVGKYERSNMSYEEITARERKEHVSYCAWMLAQRNRVDLTAQVKDFIRYLHVKNLSESFAEPCFDGSTGPQSLKRKVAQLVRALLHPPMLQLVASIKILFTAVASRMLMSKKLHTSQWLALLLLTLGVAIGGRGKGTLEDGSELPQAPLLGIALMLINCMLSSLGGVCTEMALKHRSSAELTIFATNLHMALHSLLLNGSALLLVPVEERPHPEFLRASDALALGNEALNGILISLLMRRIDAIAKNYVFSVSIFTTAGMTAMILRHWPPWQFYLGASICAMSMAIYAQAQVKAQKTQ
eukprot:s207_g8.t1